MLSLIHNAPNDSANDDGPTDASLLTRFIDAGDCDAFEQLLTRHRNLVWGTCSRVLVRAELVEDAVQITWLTLIKHASAVRGSNCGPWLYRVALRNALRIRKECAQAPASVDGVDAMESHETALDRIHRQELLEIVDCEINELPEKCRDAFIMHYLQGMRRAAIADQLNISVGAVKSRLEWARSQLRAKLIRRGVTLAAMATAISEAVQAGQPDPQVEQAVLEAAVRWQRGESIDIRLDAVSDNYFERNWTMGWSNQAFRVVAAAAVAALLLVVYSNRPLAASGADEDGAGAGRGEILLAQYASPANQARAAEPAQLPTVGVPSQRQNRTFVRQTSNVETFPAEIAAANRPSPSLGQQGIPDGVWKRESPLGTATLDVQGNRLTIRFEGANEMSRVRPTARGEFSVASDGTIYGILHSIDPGLDAVSPQELSELGEIALSGFSDLPFAIRVYTDRDALVVKNFTLGIPTTAIAALDDGDAALDFAQYAGFALNGEYSTSK